MSKRCPTCRTVVPDDARVCPNCPWIFPEDIRRIATVGTHWSPLPLLIMIGLAAVFMSGWFFLVRTADHPAAQLPTLLGEDAESDSPGFASNTKYTLRPPAPDEAEPLTSQDVSGGLLSVSPARKRTPRRPGKVWRMRGHVYDLMTLRAVPHCRMIFWDPETRSRLEVYTDGHGRYGAVLPALSGRSYRVRLVKSGYAASYLNPEVDDVRSLPARERLRLCVELRAVRLQPYGVQAHGAAPLDTDFYIVPAK